MNWKSAFANLTSLIVGTLCCGIGGSMDAFADAESKISDKAIPLQTQAIPARPKPALNLGTQFLDTGVLSQGIELPTGAVWQPSILAFGTMRSALQTFDNGNQRFSEWVNRLDLFAQLRLTGTERILLGLRPIDRGRGRNAGYVHKPKENDGWHDTFNTDIDRLFLEGDVGEIFPSLDPGDHRALDIGFSVGRQPIFKQEGMLINDNMDSVGIVRNSITLPGVSNLRVSGLFAWDHVSRNDNKTDGSAKLYGLFGELDVPFSTIDIDLAYVDGDQNGWYGGISGVQRLGRFNTSLRAMFSNAQHGDTTVASDGYLLFGEFSFTPHGTEDNAYMQLFWAIDRFSSAARRRDTGGPLGRAGILFAAVGMGNYGAALGNRTNKSGGGSIGYQKFFQGGRRQLIVELGGRTSSESSEDDAVAVGARFQQAVGHHTVLRLDGFVGDRDQGGHTDGLRAEVMVKF